MKVWKIQLGGKMATFTVRKSESASIAVAKLALVEDLALCLDHVMLQSLSLFNRRLVFFSALKAFPLMAISGSP